MADPYDIGDQPRITITFTDLAGAVTDPTSVECRIKSPTGVTTVYTYGTSPELTKTSKGIYNLDLTLTQSGDYKYKWNGTGASDQGYISVRRSLA